MRSDRRNVALLGLATLLAPRLFACGGDEAAEPIQVDDASAVVEAGAEEGSSPESEGGAILPDRAPVPVDAPPPGPPSYCQGLLFLIPFDNGNEVLVAQTAPPRVTGNVTPASGHFGQGAAFRDAGVDGAAVYYDVLDGGAPFFNLPEGTYAFWYRAGQPAPDTVALIRPVGGPNLTGHAGPVAERGPGAIGLTAALGGAPYVLLSENAAAPFMRAGDYNHFVMGWQARDDAGSPAVAIVAVNGGLGVVLGDGGPDASFDASPNEAGAITTPFMIKRAGAYTFSAGPLGSLRVGGLQATYPRGDLDDVAIWGRRLTEAEIAAPYQSPTSIRERCQLP